MAQGIDRLLLGGALAMTGLLHRRLDGVDRRIAEVEHARAVPPVPVPEPAPAAAPPAPAAPTPVGGARLATHEDAATGMPLPTGYGLQVAGPDGEDIVLPVCLPPGFELASLELVASFMPETARPAAAPAPRRAVEWPPREPAPQPAPPREPARTQLGAGLQLVYGEGGYAARIDQTEPGGAPLDPLRRSADTYASAL